MTAVLLRVRGDLRARWRAWLGLTLIMGIAGGAGLAADPDAEAPPPEPLRVRVVGIEAGAGEFPPQTQTGFRLLWLSPAFVRENLGRFTENHATAVRLKPGAGTLTSFLRETDHLGGDRPTSVYRFREQAVYNIR